MSACIGLAFLEFCTFKTAIPSPTYFTIGNAIAALAFTFAVQAFLKPVYKLRLEIRYLSLGTLYVLIFAAVGMTFLAALAPYFPWSYTNWFGYPKLYELSAGLLFALAYGIVAYAVVKPITLRTRDVERFSRATANLLSEATEVDHVDLLPDLQACLPRLIKLAAFLEEPDEYSAFYIFTHRHKLHQASYADSILRILADPSFCRTIVNRAPWKIARIIRNISDEGLYSSSAEILIREIAHQAIISNDGAIARELDYKGFGEAPVLSESIFSNYFILNKYNPLDFYYRSDSITTNILNNYNYVTVRVFETLIEQNSFHRSYAAHSAQRFYESAGMQLWISFERSMNDIDFAMQFSQAIRNAISLANKLMAAAESRQQYDRLYVVDSSRHRSDTLETLVDIVFKTIGYISNAFKVSHEELWPLALDATKSFDPIGRQPDGITPFQQRLLLKIHKGLKNNLTGLYPAISRLLLATIGPYNKNGLQPNLTAFNILRNVTYQEMKQLAILPNEDIPENIENFFPNNVTYDRNKQTLTHAYSSGTTSTTSLADLAVIEIDLLDPAYRRPLTDFEREAAQREIV